MQLRTPTADVGPTLHRGGLIDLEAATQQLECRVVEHFKKLVREIELALNSQNFLAIATQRVVVTVYCSEAHGMEPVSGWRVEVRLYKKDISESDSTFEKPGVLISAFVKNLLTGARSDAAKIVSTLEKMQAAIATRGFVHILLQCHEEVQATVRKFHNHSLAIEVHRYLSDAMEQGLRRHLPNLSMDFASELRKMQVLQENYEQTLRKDLMSKEGTVQPSSQDSDMSGKKGCGGWNFFRNSKEQLQFTYLHDRHCLLLRDEFG